MTNQTHAAADRLYDQITKHAEGSARRKYRADRRRQARLSATTGMTRFVLAWYSAKLGITSACAA
jgi:hypothetical protein